MRNRRRPHRRIAKFVAGQVAGRYNAADVRIVRFILVALLSLNMLASFTVAQPRKCDNTSAAAKSCCAKHSKPHQSSDGSKDRSHQTTCVMVCCQAVHVAPDAATGIQVTSDEHRAESPARALMHASTNPKSIFHPPRV